MTRSIHCFWLLGVFCTLAGCSHPPDSSGVSKAPGSNSPTTVTSDQTLDNLLDVAAAEATNPTKSFFSVDHYDPQRDAFADLEMTTELASRDGKRILIEVGGKW